MMDVKFDGNVGSRCGDAVVVSAVSPWPDWIARAAIVTVFAALAVLRVAGIQQLIPPDSFDKLLTVAASVANFMFLSLVAATALTRLTPIQKSKGIEPRISALLGTFLAMTLSLLPKAELSPVLSMTSTVLIIIGTLLSFVVLRWLGRSFSIQAEARQLVTSGPYRLVRHPLYICEGIALVGLVLQVISPVAVTIAIVVAVIQYRRMINEEAILRSTFPEYRAYAAQTPRLIPGRSARRWLSILYPGWKPPGKGR